MDYIKYLIIQTEMDAQNKNTFYRKRTVKLITYKYNKNTSLNVKINGKVYVLKNIRISFVK